MIQKKHTAYIYIKGLEMCYDWQCVWNLWSLTMHVTFCWKFWNVLKILKMFENDSISNCFWDKCKFLFFLNFPKILVTLTFLWVVIIDNACHLKFSLFHSISYYFRDKHSLQKNGKIGNVLKHFFGTRDHEVLSPNYERHTCSALAILLHVWRRYTL